MRRISKTSSALTSILVFAILIIIAAESPGQKMKGSGSDYAIVVRGKIRYEKYGEGEPLFYCIIAFLPLLMPV